MNKHPSVFVRTFAVAWPYVIIMSLLAWLVFNQVIAVSFFLGAITSIMLMSHNYKTTFNQLNKDPALLKRRAIQNYVFRFVLYGVILVVAHYSQGLEMIPTFVGFTSFKVALLLTALIYRGSDYNES